MAFKDFSLTSRGFAKYQFIDFYGQPCSLQKSSLATDDAIWLGRDPMATIPALMGAVPLVLYFRTREDAEEARTAPIYRGRSDDF